MNFLPLSSTKNLASECPLSVIPDSQALDYPRGHYLHSVCVNGDSWSCASSRCPTTQDSPGLCSLKSHTESLFPICWDRVNDSGTNYESSPNICEMTNPKSKRAKCFLPEAFLTHIYIEDLISLW